MQDILLAVFVVIVVMVLGYVIGDKDSL